MATLRDTRNRISSVRNTSKITQAMKMVAAAKLRRAQSAIGAARPFADQLQKILGNLATAESDFVHPYFETNAEIKSIMLIVVSSDRGLAGAFNTNLLRMTSQHSAALRQAHPGVNIQVIPVGRRAVSALRKSSDEIIREYPDIFAKLEFGTAQEIAEIVSNSFLAGRVQRIDIIYNQFVSVMRQQVKALQLLPIAASIIPEAPKKTSGADATKKPANVDYIFEPSRADILEQLLPIYLNIQVWRTLLESNAAEQAARMMAMDNATTNARDLILALQLVYNRERQASITKEMLEIVGGAEALSNN